MPSVRCSSLVQNKRIKLTWSAVEVLNIFLVKKQCSGLEDRAPSPWWTKLRSNNVVTMTLAKPIMWLSNLFKAWGRTSKENFKMLFWTHICVFFLVCKFRKFSHLSFRCYSCCLGVAAFYSNLVSSYSLDNIVLVFMPQNVFCTHSKRTFEKVVNSRFPNLTTSKYYFKIQHLSSPSWL